MWFSLGHGNMGMWRVAHCNEIELGSQMECHLVPTLSEHSACVCSYASVPTNYVYYRVTYLALVL